MDVFPLSMVAVQTISHLLKVQQEKDAAVPLLQMVAALEEVAHPRVHSMQAVQIFPVALATSRQTTTAAQISR